MSLAYCFVFFSLQHKSQVAVCSKQTDWLSGHQDTAEKSSKDMAGKEIQACSSLKVCKQWRRFSRVVQSSFSCNKYSCLQGHSTSVANCCASSISFSHFTCVTTVCCVLGCWRCWNAGNRDSKTVPECILCRHWERIAAAALLVHYTACINTV